MTIETFTKEQFEDVLCEMCEKYDDLGYIDAERVYSIPVDAKTEIQIRSSIELTGVSASVGVDSIRVWLTTSNDHKPLGTKVSKWITRQPNWQQRLKRQIDILKAWRFLAGDCPKCKRPKGIFVTKNSTKGNNGREFAKCIKCNDGFVWLDQVEKKYPAVENKSLEETKCNVQNANTPDAQTPTLDTKEKPCGDAKTTNVKSYFATSADGSPFSLNQKNNVIVTEKKSTGLEFLAPIADDDKPAAPAVKTFTPSKYQEAICEFVLNESAALRVEAYAGSGKTSTNAFVCRSLPECSGKVKMMVFSKANQLDMQAKIPEWIPATTTHSAGFSDIRRAYGKVEVDERKMWNLLKDAYSFDYDVKDNAPAVLKLVSLCKNTLSDPTNENLDELCDRYDVQCNGSREQIYDAVGNLLNKSAEQTRVINFDDMLWLPASGRVPVEPCDLLFVDEYQDNNKAQEQYYLKTHARIIFVGDAKQAIYGFRGAMIGAMDVMQNTLNAQQLPLPISYRCARSIIELAQTIVPQILPRDNAPEGIVQDVSGLALVKPGDMVLCRNNAPLVKPCFELIRNGVKAMIKGRDIGTNLMNLVRKVEKKAHSICMSSPAFLDLLVDLQDYTDTESAKLDMQHKESQAASLRDQCETIMALSEGCNSTADLERRINTIFSDDVQGVIFSTIHKAKGLESPRVFILKPQLLHPQKYDTRDWQLEQLQNLTYVAYTRAMNELYFVRQSED